MGRCAGRKTQDSRVTASPVPGSPRISGSHQKPAERQEHTGSQRLREAPLAHICDSQYPELRGSSHRPAASPATDTARGLQAGGFAPASVCVSSLLLVWTPGTGEGEGPPNPVWPHFTSSHLQRAYFQKWSHSQVPGLGLQHSFGRGQESTGNNSQAQTRGCPTAAAG